MIANNETEHHTRRIPVKFIDEENSTGSDIIASDETSSDKKGLDQDTITPEEIGNQSSYEDTTEVQRRIDRGEEGTSEADRDKADDADTAGAPPSSKLPENRENRDTNSTNNQSQTSASAQRQTQDSASSNQILAELIATRAELKRVEGECKKTDEEKNNALDRLMRAQAEFENFRKRTERERGETYNRTVGKVVRELLPVIDNMNRAIAVEASVQEAESERFRNFVHGVELIYKQLNDVLEGMGLKPVPTVGHPFDPHIHEAVATEHSEEMEPDTVVEELAKGYKLQDTLLRPAMVKVSIR